MDKNRQKIIIMLAIAVICLVAITLTLILILKTPSATKIYQKATDNVVELKAEAESVGQSFGTAEIADQQGTLITNAHVVTYTLLGEKQAFDKFYIRFSFEDDYREVELIKYNREMDVAILKFKVLPNFKLKPISIADSTKLKSGDLVYSIGNSQNYGISISQGIIGVPSINIEYNDKTRIVIQCDLTITEGNSGGALLNDRGKLIGITTFRSKDHSGNVIYGIAYCIPINIVMEYINL